MNNNRWWISIADSDIILFAKGLAIGNKFNVKIVEPDVDIMAVQGPKSFNLMEKVFGDKIVNLKFFGFDYFEFGGDKHLIARSGWSKQGGYEVYVEHNDSGLKLYDHLFEIGKEFNIKPGCPNLIERIEGGLMSYGNDFTSENNPLECNLEKFCTKDNSHNFIGKNALNKIREVGIKQKIRGIIFDGGPCPTCAKPFPVFKGKIKIGQITSGIYSPRIKKNVGLSMILKDYWNIDEEVKVLTSDNMMRTGVITSLPFPK